MASVCAISLANSYLTVLVLSNDCNFLMVPEVLVGLNELMGQLAS